MLSATEVQVAAGQDIAVTIGQIVAVIPFAVYYYFKTKKDRPALVEFFIRAGGWLGLAGCVVMIIFILANTKF